MKRGIFALLVLLAAGILVAQEKDIKDVLPKDRILAVFKPTFVTADEAEIDDDSLVIGVAVGDEAHCYSLRLLDSREIVNDVVGDTPIAATW